MQVSIVFICLIIFYKLAELKCEFALSRKINQIDINSTRKGNKLAISYAKKMVEYSKLCRAMFVYFQIAFVCEIGTKAVEFVRGIIYQTQY